MRFVIGQAGTLVVSRAVARARWRVNQLIAWEQLYAWRPHCSLGILVHYGASDLYLFDIQFLNLLIIKNNAVGVARKESKECYQKCGLCRLSSLYCLHNNLLLLYVHNIWRWSNREPATCEGWRRHCFYTFILV